MKIIDPHVDLADMYKLHKWTVDDFYPDTKEPWVTWNKIRECGIQIMGLTLYFDEEFVTTSYYDGVKDFLEFYQNLIAIHPGRFQQVLAGSDVPKVQEDQLGYFYSIEGFECLRSPADFEEFYKLGVRSFGMTWNFENEYACGRHSKNDQGITTKGREVIRMMNDKKLLVDITHLSEQSVRDLDKYYNGMIVSTHTNLRSVKKDSIHNLTDDEVQIIVDRGGVVSLFPLSEDTGEAGTFEELYSHFDYFVSEWGIDNIAICSDIYPMDEYPFLENKKDILVMKDLYEFFETKLDAVELDKLFYSNWKRVLTDSV